MANLNALIAQGYQFQPLPDPFVQYGKMQQLENSATQNRLVQQQMTEGAALAPYRLAEIKAKSSAAELELKQTQDAQDFVTEIMQKIKDNHGGIYDPMEAAYQMSLNVNPKVQALGKNLADAIQVIEGIKEKRAYAQGEPGTGAFAGVRATPAPGAAPMVPRAAEPVDLAPAAQGEAGTPVLTGTALAPVAPQANAMGASRLAQIDKRLAVLRQFPTAGEKERAELVKERDRLMTPYTVGNNLVTLGGGVAYTAPEKIVAAATSPEMKNADAFALLKGPVGSLAYNQEYAKQLARLTAKSEGAAKDDPNTTAAFREVDNAGNVTFYNKFGNPISTQKGAGKPSATFEKTAMAKVNLARDLDQAIAELTEVTKDGGLIDQSTGSGVGRAVDIGARFVGQAMPGDIAIGKLQPVADLALKMVPRFEGPQSNADTTSYKQAAGQLADPTLPPEIRKAAGKTVLRLMIARKGQFTTADTAANDAPAAAAAKPSGGGAPPLPPGFKRDN